MPYPSARHDSRPLVERYSEAVLPTAQGPFRCIVFHDRDGAEQVAMVRGVVHQGERVLCRVHSECFTSEVLGSLKCDCKAQLDAAIAAMARDDRGVLLYLRQEGRGIGLGNKIKAYALQEFGLDTVDANRHLGFADDARSYDVAAAMLAELKVRSVVLLTNNPDKVTGLVQNGIAVVERRPLCIAPTAHSQGYLDAKRSKMGHLLPL